MFLNLHTHRLTNVVNERIVYDVAVPDQEEELAEFSQAIFKKMPQDTYFSVGIHPWHISEDLYEEQLKKLAQVANNQSVKLIGCGLDRMQGVSLPLQEEVFIQQIRIAEELKKPLIIHCVKCFNELISIKKIIRPRVPLIIQGFDQSEEIGIHLLEKEFYLSIGTSILEENSNAANIIKSMPLESLFFETDEVATSIKNIFAHAAAIRDVSIEELEDIIFENFLDLSF